jgi:uncharacterized protein (DUF924 family)
VVIDAEAVWNFWFNATTPSQWFSKDRKFDARVRERFLGGVEAVINERHASDPKHL